MKKNILFIIEGGIGHNFVVTPTIKKLKEKYPKTNLIVMSPFLEVHRFNPDIDELYNSDDSSTGLENLYKRIRGDFVVMSPSVYKEFNHMTNDENLHIKEIIGKQCDVDVKKSDKLYYFPTTEEIDRAKIFKDKKTDGRKLGIVQINGSGIGNNPTHAIKGIPVKTVEKVIEDTKNSICWVQVRLGHEQRLSNAEYDLVNYEHRKIFALLSVADIGLGTDSFSQHFMSGVYNIPYVMCLGRGRAENYAHEATVVVSNPSSCEYFGCEFPFFGIVRICKELKCMNSITPRQIVKKIQLL